MDKRTWIWLAGGAILCGGCGVERTMVIESDPPGALVYLNDEEVGRTPLRRDFTWYGNYDVEVRKEGYQTLRTNTWVVAPWWQWPPFDLFAELVPARLKDVHELDYTLSPADEQLDPDALLNRALETRRELRGSPYTVYPPAPPTTREASTTQPADAPGPATLPQE